MLFYFRLNFDLNFDKVLHSFIVMYTFLLCEGGTNQGFVGACAT